VYLIVATLGLELVPSLQPSYNIPNNTVLDTWWVTRRLPALLRPRRTPCEPTHFGRGDIIQLSPSLFDYTILNVWNTTENFGASGMQPKRVAYRGQSFSGCYAKVDHFFYNLVDGTQTTTVGDPYYICILRSFTQTVFK
jgi:hypothetical protein